MNKLLLFFIGALCTISGPVKADPLNVMYGVSRPPFIMESERSGISYELAAAAFKRMGVGTKPFFGSNERLEVMLEKDRVHVAVEVQQTDPDLHYSDRFVAYRNFAVSRKRDNIEMLEFADLRGHSVCAWQNAHEHLEITELTSQFSSYREFPEQVDQVRLWLAKRCDVIFIDDTLLKWHIRTLAPELERQGITVDTDLRFDPFPGDNQLWFFVGFRDSAMRDSFDQALAEMRADGSYDQIREGFFEPLLIARAYRERSELGNGVIKPVSVE